MTDTDIPPSIAVKAKWSWGSLEPTGIEAWSNSPAIGGHAFACPYCSTGYVKADPCIDKAALLGSALFVESISCNGIVGATACSGIAVITVVTER
jgi:hypothetical protein